METNRAVIVLVALCFARICNADPSTHADDAKIRTFLASYFTTWSAGDLKAYGSCFHAQAQVTYQAPGGQVISMPLNDFLQSQRLAHQQARTPMTEKPLEMSIQGDERVVQAAVKWVLTKDAVETLGTDFFTLIRVDNEWKIVALIFYGE